MAFEGSFRSHEVCSLREMDGEPSSSCKQQSNVMRITHVLSRVHPVDWKQGQDWRPRHLFRGYYRNPSGW